MNKRVERMFGPRSEWGKDNEWERVEAGKTKAASRAVKKEVVMKVPQRKAVLETERGNVPAAQMKKQGFSKGLGKGINGFVSIRCEGCDKVINTCLREKRTIFVCKSCGHPTPLEGLANIHFKCGCGFVGCYRTNRREKAITMECLNCSDIAELTRIRRGNYIPTAEVAV